MILALLGGTFDPVHAGHVAMVEHLLAHGLADHVVVVPNWRSPWRDEPVAPARDRLAMCRLAFAPSRDVTVDDREIAGGRAAHTVDTLESLTAARPDDQWRLVVGADHVPTFGRWRDAERILALAQLVVLGRAGAPDPQRAAVAAGLPGGRVIVAPPFDHPVSSSSVRAMLAAGRGVEATVPPAVADYMDAHRLYRAG